MLLDSQWITEEIKEEMLKHLETNDNENMTTQNPYVKVALYNPMGYAVHGIIQARILERVAFPFSNGSSNPGIEPRSPTLQVDSLPAKPSGKPMWGAVKQC